MDPVTTEPVVPALNRSPAAPVTPVTPQAEARPLISDKLRQPAWLWLTHVLPIGLLIWSGQNTYSVIAGELSAAERWQSLGEAVVLIAMAVASAGIALWAQGHRHLVTNRQCLALVVMSSVCMAMGICFTTLTMPWSIPEWIASPEELLYRSFCLAMPGAFYALLLLSSAPRRARPGVAFAKALGLAILCLGGTFLFFNLFGRLIGDVVPPWAMMMLFGFILFAGGNALTAAVIRMTLLAYTSIRRLPIYTQQGFMCLIGLIGPLAGLALNSTIAFPVDFQAPVIYALAAINGVLLLMPATRSIWRHRVIWLAQCVMFPFSAYFFIVFLPWLPAAPFAMIIMGAGFLMLVPLVLGLVHGYRLVDGYREEVRDGVWWKPALLGLAAVLLLPTVLGWSMWQDRQTLDEALNYVYAPDYRKDIMFPGDPDRLKNTLQHLRNMKHGIFLPFISPVYNEVVFHGLVLPDTKIDDLQHAFFGGGPQQQVNALLNSRSGGNNRPVTRSVPPSDVVLTDVQAIPTKQGPVTISRLTLTMQNRTDAQSEFVTSIHIPEGVYVSDFGLYINNELVPARIVEKKTAMWVYEKISVVEHRDPGLLIYKKRTELELRVFPFAGHETRRVVIELTHPNATPTPISIGEGTVTLDLGPVPQKTIVTSCATPSGSVAVAEGTNLAALGMQRTPYLDMLIDCSEGGDYSAETIADSLRQARQAFPEAKLAKITAVNYEARDIVSDLIPVDQLDAAAIAKNLLPYRGGFLEDRFLKRGLLQASDLSQKGAPDALLRPQFVIISAEHSQAPMREGNLESFLRLVPDARVIYARKPGAGWQSEDMATQEAVLQPHPTNVILWKWADHYAVSPAGSRAAATFPGSAMTGEPLFYQATSGQFIPAPTNFEVAANSRFADGVRTWAAQDEATLNPSILQNGAAALIGLSKQTRILVPDSSYIAVETAAQWKAMEEKEKLKLKNKQVFELEEPIATVPEPSTWVLLSVGLIVLWFKRRKPASRSVA